MGGVTMALHDPGNRAERADDRTERLAELTHEAADAITRHWPQAYQRPCS